MSATQTALIVVVPEAQAVTLNQVSFFDDRVVWLAPRPQEPLQALTLAVWRRFPQAPPYGGAFDDVVPHLTIGHDAGLPELRRAASAVAAQLPVRAAVSSVRLVRGSDAPGSWHTGAELPLGEASTP